jgi:aminoglycoside phosphotransferase (APT) family kinase protein
VNDDIRAWVERETGGRILGAQRPPTGGSRDLFLIDVERPDGSTDPVVLRLETGGAFTGTPISLRREAAVYRALEGSAVPVPRLVAFADDGSALLVERLAGTPDFRSLDAAEREQTYADFVRGLAALHSLDVNDLALEGFAIPKTPEEHARLDLAVWASICDTHVTDLDPLVVYAGSWLEANAPGRVQRTVLVQGDTGPGNFLSQDGRVTGIVDWEFAHISDPMADLAWLEMRTLIHGGRLDWTPHLDAYARATGLEIDLARIDYYRVGVYYRCAVTTALAVARGGGARGFAPYVLQGARFHRSLGEALLRVTGIEEPEGPLPDVTNTPRTPWFDRIVDGIREVVRGVEDVNLRERTRNLQILLQRLRAWDAAGAQLEAMDADDRTRALGLSAGDDAGLRAQAAAAGGRSDEATLRYLIRRQRREAALWGRLMERRRA